MVYFWIIFILLFVSISLCISWSIIHQMTIYFLCWLSNIIKTNERENLLYLLLILLFPLFLLVWCSKTPYFFVSLLMEKLCLLILSGILWGWWIILVFFHLIVSLFDSLSSRVTFSNVKIRVAGTLLSLFEKRYEMSFDFHGLWWKIRCNSNNLSCR